MYKNTFTHYLTKFLVNAAFYLGIPFVATIFWWTQFFEKYLAYNPAYFSFLTVILTLSGLAGLFGIWQLKKLFATLVGGDPFVDENVARLRNGAIASFMISIIFLLKELVVFTIASGLIMIIFAFLGLFCLTLKDVFKQAVTYKQENDWTV